jgi:hypothetical protein
MDRWGWQQMEPWLDHRVTLPVGALLAREQLPPTSISAEGWQQVRSLRTRREARPSHRRLRRGELQRRLESRRWRRPLPGQPIHQRPSDR